jgi:hypothetical protein
MLLVGGRRLRHVGHLGGDPLVMRFTGLGRMPTARTLARRLAAMRKLEMNELDRLMLASTVHSVRGDGGCTA